MSSEQDPFCPEGEWRQEQKREFDPTYIAEDDPELLEEIEHDEFADVSSGAVLPRVKITTQFSTDSCLEPFGKSLEELIPNAVFAINDADTISQTIANANAEDFTDLLVLNSVHDEVDSMLHIHLPNGPSAMWRITSIALPEQIPGHGNTTQHYPKIFMKRFETRLGKLTSRMLRSLFPAECEPKGRRVMTFHLQRDFVFFRHYRYIFESGEKVRMQECGPRFTMRLLWLQEGKYDPANGNFTFYRRMRHEKSRTRWWL